MLCPCQGPSAHPVLARVTRAGHRAWTRILLRLRFPDPRSGSAGGSQSSAPPAATGARPGGAAASPACPGMAAGLRSCFSRRKLKHFLLQRSRCSPDGFCNARFQFPGWGGASRSALLRSRVLASLGVLLPAPARPGPAVSGSSEGSVHAQSWPGAAQGSGFGRRFPERCRAPRAEGRAGALRAAAPGLSPAIPAGHAEHPQLPVEHRGPPGPGGHGLCLQSSQQGERGRLGARNPKMTEPWCSQPSAPRDARAPLQSPCQEILAWGAAQGLLWVLFSFSVGLLPLVCGSGADFGALTAGSCSPRSRVAKGDGAAFRGMPRAFGNPILGHLHTSCKYLPGLERALLLSSL